MAYSMDSRELREQLKWLIRIRWIGILGVFIAVHVIREAASLTFPLIPVYAILGFAAAYNAYFSRALKFSQKEPLKLAVAQIFLDQFTLAFAMYFSGGCDSPLIYFFIFHIVISGIMLPLNYTIVFSVLAVFFPSVVMGLKHFGVLPHFGIFSNEPMLFVDPAVIGSYGAAFIGTVILTAYFVTYLSRRLHLKNEEVKRLYALSERLRSSIRLTEVVSMIEKELCGFTKVRRSSYMPLDKNMRTLTFKSGEKEMKIPLLDNNSFTEALLNGHAMFLDRRIVGSDYEKGVLDAAGAGRCLILPVLAASLSRCFEYFNCNDRECAAYGHEDEKCWQISGTHCKGRMFRNYVEKLDSCLSCELFRPVGLYVLNVEREFTPLDKVDMDGCMRLLDAAGLAVSNALLFEKTLGLSKIDGLTGLKNHREFKEILSAEFLRARRYQRPFALIMMDIDSFKHYNDNNGHPQGDILLKKLAELIRENLKDTDVVARYGGEEFAIILFEIKKSQALKVAERLRGMIEWFKLPKEDSQPDGKLTVSIGLSAYPDDADSMEKLIDGADAALYKAKRGGKNRVETAGVDMVN